MKIYILQSMANVEKKIWIITELYYPTLNSTGYYMTEIAEYLAKNNQDVNVLCSNLTYNTNLVTTIKNEVRKYIKREKSKRPPEGFNFWAFDCKFGKTAEEATEIKFVDVTKSIDFAASEGYDSFYLELIARADIKKVKEIENLAKSKKS